MRKLLLKIGIIASVFVTAIFVFEILLNRQTTSVTAEMDKATFPVIYFRENNISYNPMFGYSEKMNIKKMRECITPVEDRTATIMIDKCGNAVSKIAYEIRSIDGEHLIENGELTDKTEDENVITTKLSFNDLLKKENEYSLNLELTFGGNRKAYYYTTIIEKDNCKFANKLDFVFDFNKMTFEKDQELADYIESNGAGDDYGYAKVNINSSFDNITWGKTGMEQMSNPVAYVTDIGADTAIIAIKYCSCIREDENVLRYYVEEKYRIREGEKRYYLLDFERITTKMFFPEDEGVEGNIITLGITDENIDMVESKDGNIVAFVNGGALYVADIPANRVSKVFAYYDRDNIEIRNILNKHDIKILSLTENGEVVFSVNGYVNRGNHEGSVGIMIMTYSGEVNCVEERAFIPYDGSYERLKLEKDNMLKYSPQGMVYFYIADSIYAYSVLDDSLKCIVKNSEGYNISSSESENIIAWQNDGDYATELNFLNADTGQKRKLKAEEGEYFRLEGFIGEDLIYGIIKAEDMFANPGKKINYPEYKLIMIDEKGNVIKEYCKSGYYVNNCILDESMITIERKEKVNNEFVDAPPDTILYTKDVKTTKNKIETTISEKYKKVVRILLKSQMNEKNLKIASPEFAIAQDDKIQSVDLTDISEYYYVYDGAKIDAGYKESYEAVLDANKIGGVVTDESGRIVWKKGSHVQKNQIMAITGKACAEGENELTTCLKTVCEFEGYPLNTETLPTSDEKIENLFEECIPGVKGLDMSGCSIDILIYFLNKDIPIVAVADDKTILLTGFNEYEVVWMDPADGTLFKKPISETEEYFEKDGSRFYTYMYLN